MAVGLFSLAEPVSVRLELFSTPNWFDNAAAWPSKCAFSVAKRMPCVNLKWLNERMHARRRFAFVSAARRAAGGRWSFNRCESTSSSISRKEHVCDATLVSDKTRHSKLALLAHPHRVLSATWAMGWEASASGRSFVLNDVCRPPDPGARASGVSRAHEPGAY